MSRFWEESFRIGSAGGVVDEDSLADTEQLGFQQALLPEELRHSPAAAAARKAGSIVRVSTDVAGR